MKKAHKRTTIQLLSVLGAVSFVSGSLLDSVRVATSGNEAAAEAISRITTNFKSNVEKDFDDSVVYNLPASVENDDDISVIVTMNTDTVMDTYDEKTAMQSLADYVASAEGRKVARAIDKERSALIQTLNASGISYKLGQKYDTILSGFEITVKASDFKKIERLVEAKASLIVGETYEPAEYQVVTNDVDVYETGIFDTSASEYQGDGVVVAVLDTGLDYTHSAFSIDNFHTDNEAFTLDSVSAHIKGTRAAERTPGLTGEDVYINRKVPFAYDYADSDPDVLPIDSEHGTHVAGIIAGKDDVITGVAPNAQLAIMKVFSDSQSGGKDSWILAALEDCVKLGVDVINMSLGSACGFAREVDTKKTNEIYDSIREAGISLICSAGNAYNATTASEKNGSLGLTSNPDSGTVSAPSSYAAALSVASVDGVKTPYLTYNGKIIYFNEASTASAEEKDFVDDILSTVGDNVESHEFEYVTIPGIGRSSDYPHEKEFYKGKIVLVKRGTTTFEDKVRVAQEKGAAGIIIYNNISGSISMSVGEGVGPVCSIAQDEGEMLAAAGTGKLLISRRNSAGPFMSNFSSWGPTSDLQIKPEITAHGGEIYSAIPGQGYDHLSGTSMAAPNQAGAAALIRQYVKYSGNFGENVAPTDVTAIVNKLMMSTADIIYNKNGLPYSVRKQGAGLINITKSTKTASYVTTYDKNGKAMDKSKIELGDDKEREGVYEMKMTVCNFSSASVQYEVSSVLLTEGVSKTYTSHGDTTVTQEGYLLNTDNTVVTKIEGNGTQNGNRITVNANSEATITVKVTLTEEDKKYMDDSFAHGMYVDGHIMLKAVSGTFVNMNVPVLAFYGDWTEAPIFDEEYYDTHKDEINLGLDPEDKLMADAYATRVYGTFYSDYIGTLGAYYFQQDPSATQIATSKEHIALSNQEKDESSTLNAIRSISAGLLRNVKEVQITITEDATGEVIFRRTEYNQRKSSSGGGTVHSSSIDVDFSIKEHKLKNNTKYTVKVQSFIDYGEKEDQKNVRDTFEFPFYVDFQAPAITDVEYRTEYDQTSKKTKLFADISVYDNHYTMGMRLGQIIFNNAESQFELETFGKYPTPVYSSYNSTSKITVELTDYVAQLKESEGFDTSAPEGGNTIVKNNSFIAICYDYAMNSSTFEIRLPDEILDMSFTEEQINLSPNETLDLTTVLNVFPNESWLQVLDFETSDKSVVDIVNQTLIAKQSGDVTITAKGTDFNGNQIRKMVSVKVLSPEDEGYVPGYTVPEVNKFELDGYYVNKAFYFISSEDREIGETDFTYDFVDYELSMFPSESVTILPTLDSYFPDDTDIEYTSFDESIATVEKVTMPRKGGLVVAQAEGTTIISVNVTYKGQLTLHSAMISITVKDPFETSAMYLTAYRGLGGHVEIPRDKGITTIESYAFCGYDYVEKDLEAGDVIDEEDPYMIKPMYIGDNTITSIKIPEGVTTIASYAFANLTALETVELPSTLNKIGVGAFIGCEKLKNINLENVQFINKEAFKNCALEEIKLNNVVAIGDYTFENCNLGYIDLPETSQSLGIGAFYNNDLLSDVKFYAPKIKIGAYAFAECDALTAIDINAAVIASYAFQNCALLWDVELGKDVAVIGEYAFAGTQVAAFGLDAENTALELGENGALLYKKGTDSKTLILVAPLYSGVANTITTDATEIAIGALSGNTSVQYIVANSVKTVGAYAFAGCTNLQSIEMNNLEEIGEYAFSKTAITQTPNLSKVSEIGAYSFAGTKIVSVTIANDVTVDTCAFADTDALTEVTIGNNVVLGEGAFRNRIDDFSYEKTEETSNYVGYNYEVKDETGKVVRTFYYYRYNHEVGLHSILNKVTIGNNVTVGDYAFADNARLTTLTIGDEVTLGNYAFYNAVKLTNLSDKNLKGVTSLGDYAFSGNTIADRVWYGEGDESQFVLAYEKDYVNGEIVNMSVKYTSVSASFANVELDTAEKIGVGAFMNNINLTTATLGNITTIPAYAFANCASLNGVELIAMTAIGDYAFAKTSMAKAELPVAESIGAYAFERTQVTEATLKEGATVGDGAFAYNKKLAKVNGISGVREIGAYAFTDTALQSVELTKAEKVGSFAFSLSAITDVSLGENLKELGENPFFGCEIESYGKIVDVEFNGKPTGTTSLLETYDVSDSVFVKDGVLYQKLITGVELVSYPMNKTNTHYIVEEGTVRITANAFAQSAVESVVLPSTLVALGDRAFYGCNALRTVAFTSYDAPILEEDFNEAYITDDNLPFNGYMGSIKGLGILKYYMWNIGSNSNNYYFGATFVDYIGHNDKNLVMVYPVNGKNYDSFIFSQYFGSKVEGKAAATQATRNVISMIDKLPATTLLTVNDADAVYAVRDAFNALSDLQKSLVSNSNLLSAAENMIKYLLSSSDNQEQEPQPTPPAEDGKKKDSLASVIILTVVITVGAIAAIVAVAFFVIKFLPRKSKIRLSFDDEEAETVEETAGNEEQQETEKSNEDE